jgi:hypothetical protein
MKRGFTQVPSENDFLAAFGVEPIESAPQDGFWCYSFESDDGNAVRLSFNIHERSVQTVWMFKGRAVCTVVHENADEIRISNEVGAANISATFAHERDECRTQLRLQIAPDLEINWTSLRT